MKYLTLEEFKCIYSDWERSGLSIPSFCNSIGIHSDKFYYWRKRLEEARHMPASGQGFVPVRLSKSQQNHIDVQRIQPSASASPAQDSLCELVYPNGVTLRITSDMTLDQLRAMVSLLN